MTGEDGSLLTFRAGHSPLSSCFTSPQAPRHFEIERERISLLSLFPPLFPDWVLKVWSLTQPCRHTFTGFLYSLPYTPTQTPSQMQPQSLEINKDLLGGGIKTTLTHTAVPPPPLAHSLCCFFFFCCLFSCTASWLVEPFFNNISSLL